MSRTYTIDATSMNAGRRSSMTTNWSSFQAGEASGLVTGYSSAGYSSSFYRLVNMRFDTSAYSSKTITAITLRITIASGTLGSTSYPYQVRYKLNDTTTTSSSGDAWTSSDSAQSAAGNYQLATWSNGNSSGTTTITANSTHDFSVGTTLPKYGYVIGGTTGNAYMTLTYPAKLLITTNETLTLAYNANGGSGAPSSSTKNGTPNATFTISSTTPTRAGYQFLGWSTSSTATSASYSAGGSITLSTTGTTTLYAVWKAYVVTIKYNANGGTMTTGTGTTRYRVSNSLVQKSTDSGSTWADLTATISTGTAYVNLHNVCGSSYDGGVKRTGYVIESGVKAYRVGSGTSGTIINQDTTSASDTNAATIQNLTGSATLTSNVTVTLYIRWGVKIRYNANGAGLATSHGSGYAINSSNFITYNDSYDFHFVENSTSADLYNYNNSSAINLSYTGHHIKSSSAIWNTAAGGTGTNFDQSTSNTAATYAALANSSGVLNLYANWLLDTYTISYNKGSYGTGTNTTDTKTYNVALTLRGAIFTRAGYTQDGWSTTDGGAKAYELGGSYTTNAATTLYPFWKLSSIIHVRVGNQIKDGMVYVKQNGEMKIGIVYVKNNNTMKPTQ